MYKNAGSGRSSQTMVELQESTVSHALELTVQKPRSTYPRREGRHKIFKERRLVVAFQRREERLRLEGA